MLLRLPELECEGQRWQLPLADATAQRLAAAFVADSQEAATIELDAALRTDPYLTLWAVIHWQSDARPAPRTVATLAGWLQSRLLSLLAPLVDAENSLDSATAGGRQQIADLCEASLTVAAAAADQAAAWDETDEQGAEQAYLFGLLSQSLSLLAAVGVELSPTDLDTPASPLPAWLAQSLQALAALEIDDKEPAEEGNPAVAAARHVAAAHYLLSAEEESAEEFRQQARLAAELWRSEPAATATGAGNWLPGLVGRLSRLEVLERDFHDQLLREKLAALREFTYGASHDINNPLANISSRAQSLLRGESDPERRRKLSTIHSHAMRAHEMVAAMALFARPPKLQAEPVDLAALVDEVFAELTPLASERSSTLRRSGDASPPSITADPVQLAVLLREMCGNSLEAFRRAGRGGEINIALRLLPAMENSPQAKVEMVIRDDGPGLDERSRRHLFDPYFCGYESGRGMGCGLSKCWQIVDAHGGRILVWSEPGAGTSFTIQLTADIARHVAV